MKTEFIKDILKKSYLGKKVTVSGWVYRKREMKDKIFLVIRDSSNIIQAVIDSNSKSWKNAQKITIESSLKLSGKLAEDKRAPTGFEIKTQNIEIIGLAERFPISKDLSTEFLMDVRHLALRGIKQTAILKLRSSMFKAFHDFFDKHNFIEAEAPTFISEGSEGGSEVFQVKYFDKKAYLTQSWQFYAENLIHCFENVYALAPSFRAEKSSTNRHLTEFWHLEVESAWADLKDIMNLTESCISSVINRFLKKNKHELEVVGVDLKFLQSLKPPYKKITYSTAIKQLQKHGFKIKEGDDFGAPHEKYLAKDGPVFITNYPLKILKFYHGEDSKRKGYGTNFNLLFPNTGEVVDGSQRESDLTKIKERLKKAKINLGNSDWYLDSRRYGAVPHSGFGIGTERLLQSLLNLEHIRDTLPFPRFMNRIKP